MQQESLVNSDTFFLVVDVIVTVEMHSLSIIQSYCWFLIDSSVLYPISLKNDLFLRIHL